MASALGASKGSLILNLVEGIRDGKQVREGRGGWLTVGVSREVDIY